MAERTAGHIGERGLADLGRWPRSPPRRMLVAPSLEAGPTVASAESQEWERFQAALDGAYALERELGRGGMAIVYLARDRKHGRPVALKVLHPDLGAALGAERFQREIKVAARLQHPHILTVYDSGEAAGRLWFTMPYVEGETLRDRLARERQL